MKEDVYDAPAKMLNRSGVEWRMQYPVPTLKLLILTEKDVHLMADVLSQEI